MVTMKDEEIYLCRCENLTRKDVLEQLEAGVTSMEEMKRILRCCKGPCQGRTCRDLIAAEMSRYLNIPMEELDIPTFRPPLTPISFGAIARGGE